MSQREGLNRRSFLKNAGLTAFAGAVASGPSVLVAEGLAAVDPRADFDTPYNRVGTDCTKWDQQMKVYGKDNIAVGMGIADMDFKVAPCITRALLERMQHENWGYLTMPQSHVDSLVNWNKKRYGLEIDPKWIMHSPAVHPGIISVLRAFSPPGTKVIVQTPTYNGFFGDIRAVNCIAEESPMKLVNGRYSMDFEDLERRISHDTNTLILCNPQNPTGNVWSREDLVTLGEICTRRRVVVLADEIHCDFVTKGQRYTPYATLPEKLVMNSVTFKSASKSFNLAAMKCAYMFTSNPDYFARIKATGHREEVNTLGMVAHRAAYNDGGEWLDQLLAYIDGNHEFVQSYIAANVPLIKYVKPQGTYLAWIDVSGVVDKIGAKERAAEANRTKAATAPTVTPEKMVERWLVEHAKVQMTPGAEYGPGGTGAGRMRMNIGTSRKMLELALNNMASALKKA